MYKNLSALLKSIKNTSALIEYDFKNEAPCIDIITQNNPLKKFLRYKEFNKNEGKFDCDNSNGTCSLTNDIYIELWGWSYENRFSMSNELKAKFGNAWTRFSADTMNSYQTTYTKAKEIYGAEGVQENKLLLEFATYTHTIGNFSLVPFSFEENTPFNPYRNTKFKDYFDLSLKFIKERVDAKTFKQYIDTFFLNDYVDSEYNVLPLFSGHKKLLLQEKMSIENVNDLLPQNEAELNEYLENVIEKIKNRGKRIANLLLEKNAKDDAQMENINETKENKFTRIKNKVILFGSVFIILFFVIYISLFAKACNAVGGFSHLVKQHGFFPIMIEGLTSFAGAALELSLFFTLFALVLTWGARKIYAKIARRYLSQCKNCKKIFALKKKSSTFVKEENISIMVELKEKDRNGEVTRTREDYIPGVRKFYDELYVCKYCGHETIKRTTKDIKKI